MHAQTFALITSLIIFVLVIELIRRQKMTFQFSFAWLSGSLLIAFFAIQQNLFIRLSELAGFKVPSNFLFFLVIVFFVFLTLLLTIYIDKQTARSEALAQELAILEFKLKQLQKK